jgi:hypothetical protein
MVPVFLALGMNGQDFAKSFELYPAISTAPVISQADADTLKAKSLAKVFRGSSDNEVALDNGVVQFRMSLQDFGKPIFLQRKADGNGGVVLPALSLVLNGEQFVVGGENPRWVRVGARGQLFSKPFDVRQIPQTNYVWPPRGMGVRFMWANRDYSGLMVEVTYQMVDREPLVSQKVTVRNGSNFPVRISSIQQGDSGYPSGEFTGDQLNWTLRPNRVVELPDGWFRLDGQGKLVASGRKQVLNSLMPWSGLGGQTLGSWPADTKNVTGLKLKRGEVILIPTEAKIPWSVPEQVDFDTVRLVADAAKKSGLVLGAEVDLGDIPGELADRVGGSGSPVCWHSFAGVFWRQNVLANWKRMGIQVVELKGELPSRCSQAGHGEHQTPNQAAIENHLAVRDLMRQGLSVGIIIRHPDVTAYGPDQWE